MGNNLFTYVQQLEILAFFSGYPLIFFLVRFLAAKAAVKIRLGTRAISILPYAYALVGTLYFSLQLINLFPDYSIEKVSHRIQQPFLYIWALSSTLFWIPALSKRPISSLLHSLPFFLLLIRDLLFTFTGVIRDREVIRNEMSVYTVSVFLNLAAFILVLLSSLISFRKKQLKP